MSCDNETWATFPVFLFFGSFLREFLFAALNVGLVEEDEFPASSSESLLLPPLSNSSFVP